MFNFPTTIQMFADYYRVHGRPHNNAVDYGVTIESPDESPVWRVLGVRHLSPEENRGNHNVYIEVLRKEGERDEQRVIHWTWRGRTEGENAPDVWPGQKPPNELVNLPLSLGMVVSVWLNGSEVVHGLSSNHADEGGGNSIGHHSFFICFQEIGEAESSPLPDDDHGEVVLSIKKAWLDGLLVDDDGFVRLRASLE